MAATAGEPAGDLSGSHAPAQWADRVAVVVVHGVADQDQGTTRDAVAALLIANSPEGARYEMVSTEAFAIPVAPIEVPAPAKHTPADRGVRETQDICSSAGLAPTQYATSKVVLTRSLTDKAAPGPAHAEVDLFEMYWADQSRLSGFVPRILSEIFTLIFRLSRLARGTVQYVWEGRKTNVPWALFAGLQALMDQALVYLIAMLALGCALLVAVMGGLAAAGNLAAGDRYALAAGLLAGLAVVGVLGLAYFWPWCKPGNGGAALTIAIALAILASLFIAGRIDHGKTGAEPGWVFFGLLVVVATGIHAAVLRAARKRFDYKPWIASLWWAVAVVVMVGTACAQLLPQHADLAAAVATKLGWLADRPVGRLILHALTLRPADWGTAPLAQWIGASIVASEVLLIATKFTWVLVGALVALWFALSVIVCVVGRRDYVQSGTVATGRLGFGLSMMSVLLVAMLGWAALSEGVTLAARGVTYRPLYFDAERPPPKKTSPAMAEAAALTMQAGVKAHSTAASAPASFDCKTVPPTGSVESIDASCFMDDRYLQSTRTFSALAILMSVLLIFLLVMFLPGVLAETKTQVGSAFQHGKWLTRCYRLFDSIVGIVMGCAALAALWVALDFLDIKAPLRFLGLPSASELEGLAEWSDRMLKPLVISAAGGASVFVLFGGLISKYLPQWRAPLDVMLDVDNYFRKFPKGGVPRAMMMSRLDALLKWLQPRYDRIVIVAHSQGTVITADLLRFRVWRASLPGSEPPPPPVHFVTFGSPLRQLYAARFPELYRWVLNATASPRVGGPPLEDSGVARWINGFCSGDYVGRWLWSSNDASRAGTTGALIGHPAGDAPADLAPDLVVPLIGRYEDVSRLLGRTRELIDCSDQLECCLGYGAHTKYFEVGQTGAAWMIDHAILGALLHRPSGAPPHCGARSGGPTQV